MKYVWLTVFLALCGFVPRDGRAQTAARRQDYLNRALRGIGNPENGRQLFFDEERLACSRCHEIEGTSPKVGPSLSTIGDKFGRRELVEAILSPSAQIAVGFETTILKTSSGEEYSGLLHTANDSSVQLILGNGTSKQIPKAEITEQSYSLVSVMPQGLEQGISTNEFLDLVEFLETLKLPESANLAAHGTPAEIPKTSQSVILTPFHSEDLKFWNPVWFGSIPGSTNNFLIVEHQTGIIWRLDKCECGDSRSTFLDLGTNVIAGGTRGLIGFAFHPEYLQNRRYFIALHTVERGVTKTLTLEREAAPDLLHDSKKPPRRILEIDASSGNHYGGSMAFGPDHMLYIGMGDTGPQEDPLGNSQNMSLLRGKIMRIDIDHPDDDRAYSIPKDNPFAHTPGVRPEIWAYGFREPWRFSFDPITGDLWVGDVGQDRYEEVDLVRRGGNYGWNVIEGFEKFSNKYKRDGETYLPPVFAYNRKYGPSVTGGYVFRGDPKNPLYGAYVFADYETRRIFALWHENGTLKRIYQIGTSPERVASFGQDGQRNLYVVGYEGTIFLLDPKNLSIP